MRARREPATARRRRCGRHGVSRDEARSARAVAPRRLDRPGSTQTSPSRPSSSRSVAATRRTSGTPDPTRAASVPARAEGSQPPHPVEPDSRMPRRLDASPPSSVDWWRDVEEGGASSLAERVVATQHRNGIGGIELLDAVRLPVPAAAQLDRRRRRGAFLTQFGSAGRSDEPAFVTLGDDRDRGVDQRPPADAARDA